MGHIILTHTAAESIPVAPSTISSSLHKLENDLGIPLLIHTYRGIELTETAQKIAAMTSDVLAKMEEIECVINSSKGVKAAIASDNKVTVYMAQGYYQGALVRIMEYFRNLGFDANFPDVSCSNEEHLKLVSKDKNCISLTFFTEPMESIFDRYPNVNYIKVKSLKPQVVCAKDCTLIPPDKKFLTPKEVISLPLLRFTEGYDQAMAIFEMLEDYGRVNIISNFSNITVMQAMMLNNKGVSVGTTLNLYSHGAELSDLRFIPIKIEKLLSFAICYHRKLAPHKQEALKKMTYDIN